MSSFSLQFLGAAGTVTGSRYLVEFHGRRLLVDCGLFQGFKPLRLRNRAPLPIDPASLDAVILTHAHLDHSGYLPLLARLGFDGPVYCTPATRDLCGILLPDSGHLQEEDARYANRMGFSRHHPALPLYTETDARACLQLLQPVEFGRTFEALPGLTASLRYAGHIMGASMVYLQSAAGTLLFSGDLGRPTDAVMRPPDPPPAADWLVLESTYGDRLHSDDDVLERLAAIICRTIERRGIVLIPSFAVGRAQTLLVLLDRLRRCGRIPPVPIYLNSPMAVEATRVFWEHRDGHRLSEAECESACRLPRVAATVEQSKALNRLREPAIIIAASGMATGGRVLHQMKAYAPDPRNTLLFAGFQAGGTRGAKLLAGASTVRIHGEDIPVRAEVANIDMLSAHADRDEILAWLAQMPAQPRQIWLTHGEPTATDTLRLAIGQRFGWACEAADDQQRVVLDAA